MKIFFENSKKERKKLGEGTREECIKTMDWFLNTHNIKCSSIIETPLSDGVILLDIGSYTDCFYLID